MSVKAYRMSDFIKQSMEQDKINARRALIESGDMVVEAGHEDAAKSKIYDIREARLVAEKKYPKFVNEVKTEFLAEAIYYVFNKVIDISDQSIVASEAVKRNYVYGFIEENGGAIPTIRKFKTSTPLLSTIASLVEGSCKKALDEVDKSDEETFKVDTQVKSDFIDELEDVDVDDVGDMVKAKVVDEVEKLVKDTKKDKEAIEDITTKAQEKIDAASKDAVKESFNRDAKKQIDQIMNRPSRSIFEAMVKSISTAAVKQDHLQEVFLSESGKINIDLVLESAVVMYSFFEMANTTKMIEVDQDYIMEVYKSLKE